MSFELMRLLTKAGEFLEKAQKHAHKCGSADDLAVWLGEEMADWRPEYKGRQIIDHPTRAAAVRFLAGIAFGMVKGVT